MGKLVALRSRYRQVRLTYTEEAGGRLSYSIYVKGLNVPWNEKQCVVRDSLQNEGPAESIEDVFVRLERICREQQLPYG